MSRAAEWVMEHGAECAVLGIRVNDHGGIDGRVGVGLPAELAHLINAEHRAIYEAETRAGLHLEPTEQRYHQPELPLAVLLRLVDHGGRS